MAAPVPTARGTPAGIKLGDGFPTKITMARLPTISFWEKTVKPLGFDGGDAIDISTMHNIQFRTKGIRKLIDVTTMTAKAGYDPNVFNQLFQSLNIRDTITVTFPDGSTECAFGYLAKCEPAELDEGVFPMVDCTFAFTNTDSAGVEQAPVITSVGGT